MTHPVALAVEPLKAEAISRAGASAAAIVAKIAEKLAAAGGDLYAAYPVPQDVWAANYKAAKAAQMRAHSLVSADDSKPNRYRVSDPYFVVLNHEKVARFVQANMDAAASQYDAFVSKLVGKIGTCVSAELSGNHVWGHSILTVEKTDGSVEKWKTQQIVNQSKNGLLFNQWPSRKLKG